MPDSDEKDGGWRPIESAPTSRDIRLRGTYPRGGGTAETRGRYEVGGYTEGWIDERGNEFWPTHWAPPNL